MTSNFYLGGEIVTGETVTHTYSYDDADWADLLTAYDGHSLTYDAIGNPLTYYNGSSYTMTWAKGRRLASVSRGSSSASYAYDMDGIRTSKTVNGVTTEFITQNGRVVRQSWSGNVLDFFNHSQHRPYAVTYKPADGAAATYYYITNLQGDVVALIDSSGSLAAEYTYNAWGAPLTMPYGGAGAGAVWPPIAELNPLRYRGYYYDAETGFYYLQSRYYDPKIGRFINADSQLDTAISSGLNLFSYCENNPICNVDPDGYRLISPDIMRLIHNEVAKRVAAEVGGTEGLYVKKTTSGGETKRGFLDVYDSKTNSYYEIKSMKSAFSKRTQRQMEKYDGAEPVNNSQGPITRGKEYVSGSFTFLIYDVHYQSVDDGLVAYETKINMEYVAAGAVATLWVFIGILSTLVTGAPAYNPA